MRLIRKKEIKFIKLCLISPWLEQVVNFLYLISLPVLIFKFLEIPLTFNTYEINQISRNSFKESDFRTIVNKSDLVTYTNNLLTDLYQPKTIPFYVPIGAVRVRRYVSTNECSSCSYNKFLAEGKFIIKSDDQDCIFNVSNVTLSSLAACTQIWDPNFAKKNSTYYTALTNATFYDGFVFPFSGYYSDYDLAGPGEFIDMSMPNNITLSEFFSDKNTKCKNMRS
jgi:hypothetical protein